MRSGELLYDEELLRSELLSIVPPGYKIRPLSIHDYKKGLMECLESLTVIGNVTEQMFVERFLKMKSKGSYYVTVVVDEVKDKIVATGTLFNEFKFVRSCGTVGHIEDIAVHKDYQGKKLGAIIINNLKNIAIKIQCYKITLNCNNDNIRFYEKCGFSLKDNQMTLYLNGTQKL
ncbi:Glucosamine 6-phosphate N-acetyltransferase 1 [Zancudomyces culisetae]|uniref:Glucosamine 6-phosphate N-acetyltransferase n=1 Tax=Zancudomyces culisetae TaxID=1213189 RepID=A0A1R1PJW0_ZANCU|nr:Glucosamine 6-phosphate N-acetyltransferase 1 [Zancudomyces culisetae]|eukprot:OMH81227.1 Glucosamine 6-phosphate N-acetyltransferase 1 [Zancudomyces culisetae]